MSSAGDLVHELRPAAGDPAGALVLMHGRGTSEHDLFGLLDAFDPRRRLVGVTPRAPLSLPPGGAHWYAVRQVGFPDPRTLHPTFELLSGWLDALLADLGVGIERTVLGGFSQGAVMAHALGLARERPAPAGILAMSGFIPTVEDFELDLEARTGLPVAIAHGSLDPVISVDFGRDARDRLTSAGAEVLYRETAVPHTVDPAVVPDLAGWLERTVPTAAA